MGTLEVWTPNFQSTDPTYPLVFSSMTEGFERYFSRLHVTTIRTKYNQHTEGKGLFPIKVVEVLAYEVLSRKDILFVCFSDDMILH